MYSRPIIFKFFLLCVGKEEKKTKFVYFNGFIIYHLKLFINGIDFIGKDVELYLFYNKDKLDSFQVIKMFNNSVMKDGTNFSIYLFYQFDLVS